MAQVVRVAVLELYSTPLDKYRHPGAEHARAALLTTDLADDDGGEGGGSATDAGGSSTGVGGDIGESGSGGGSCGDAARDGDPSGTWSGSPALALRRAGRGGPRPAPATPAAATPSSATPSPKATPPPARPPPPPVRITVTLVSPADAARRNFLVNGFDVLLVRIRSVCSFVPSPASHPSHEALVATHPTPQK